MVWNMKKPNLANIRERRGFALALKKQDVSTFFVHRNTEVWRVVSPSFIISQPFYLLVVRDNMLRAPVSTMFSGTE